MGTMSCEIYDRLTESSLLDDTGQTECEYEPDCEKTCEDCIHGQIIKRADELSREAAATPEDHLQEAELAKLEAQRAAEEPVTPESIEYHSIKNSLISIARIN